MIITKKWKCLRREFCRIHLVDRCLIVFMFFLLAQSAYSLLTHTAWTSQSNEIDVIVRTSAASIFGYFLSANFIRRDAERSELSGESLDTGPAEDSEEEGEADRDSGEGNLQILIATAIGLFCLVTLIALRNIGAFANTDFSATAAATITQFRDFVSGCVGFLIGCPTSVRK